MVEESIVGVLVDDVFVPFVDDFKQMIERFPLLIIKLRILLIDVRHDLHDPIIKLLPLTYILTQLAHNPQGKSKPMISHILLPNNFQHLLDLIPHKLINRLLLEVLC
jgi:hypothetical protein